MGGLDGGNLGGGDEEWNGVHHDTQWTITSRTTIIINSLVVYQKKDNLPNENY